MQKLKTNTLHRFTYDRMAFSDLDRVLEIERSAFSSPWTRAMFLSELYDNPFSFSFVAKERDQIIGYIFFWVVFDELHILNVAVHPQWRRRRAGNELIALVLRFGRERGVRKATLEVRASNVSAQTLYKKFGFREVGVRRHYYHDPTEDALLFQSDLG